MVVEEIKATPTVPTLSLSGFAGVTNKPLPTVATVGVGPPTFTQTSFDPAAAVEEPIRNSR
mgnify:CR=1 FL=1